MSSGVDVRYENSRNILNLYKRKVKFLLQIIKDVHINTQMKNGFMTSTVALMLKNM